MGRSKTFPTECAMPSCGHQPIFLALVDVEDRVTDYLTSGTRCYDFLKERGYEPTTRRKRTKTAIAFCAHRERQRPPHVRYPSSSSSPDVPQLMEASTPSGRSAAASASCFATRQEYAASDIFDLHALTLEEARAQYPALQGLGEMNPNSSTVTTRTENRTLLRVTVEDAEAASDTFRRRAATASKPRRVHRATPSPCGIWILVKPGRRGTLQKGSSSSQPLPPK